MKIRAIIHLSTVLTCVFILVACSSGDNDHSSDSPNFFNSLDDLIYADESSPLFIADSNSSAAPRQNITLSWDIPTHFTSGVQFPSYLISHYEIYYFLDGDYSEIYAVRVDVGYDGTTDEVELAANEGGSYTLTIVCFDYRGISSEITKKSETVTFTVD